MRIADFNYFDWFLVLIVAISMVSAFRRGLVRAIFGLLGIIAGFQLAAWNYRMVGDWIDASRIRVSLSTARVIAFLVIVVVVAALLELAGRFLQKLLRHVGLGWFDRTLGAAFGFARGCIVGIAVLMAVTTFAPQSGAVTTSELTPYLFAVAHDVSFLVPQYLQELMVDGAIDFRHGAPNWIHQP
jgi:membrane protein required for colicin V production